MCLSTLIADRTTKRVGYKILGRRDNGEVYAGYLHGLTRHLLKAGEWAADTASILLPHNGGEYPTGFHLCLTYEDARSLRDRLSWRAAVIRKVRFRKTVAVGEQRGVIVVVAREIMLVADGK